MTSSALVSPCDSVIRVVSASHVLCSGGDGNEAFSDAKISFLWNRFHVDLDDASAGQKIRALIEESAKVIAHLFPVRLRTLISRVLLSQALAPKVFEQFHKLAQWLHQ